MRTWPKDRRPSSAAVVDEPITDGSGFVGMPACPGGPVIVDGREFLVRYAVERYGWLDDPRPGAPYTSHSAQAFAHKVYERYPAIRHDEHRMVVDIVDLLSESIPDPHDWDEIGSALDMIQYIERIQ